MNPVVTFDLEFHQTNQAIQRELSNMVNRLNIDEPCRIPITNIAEDSLKKLKETYSQKGYVIKVIKEITTVDCVTTEDDKPIHSTQQKTMRAWIQIEFAKPLTEGELNSPNLPLAWIRDYKACDVQKGIQKRLQEVHTAAIRYIESCQDYMSSYSKVELNANTYPKILLESISSAFREHGYKATIRGQWIDLIIKEVPQPDFSNPYPLSLPIIYS